MMARSARNFTPAIRRLAVVLGFLSLCSTSNAETNRLTIEEMDVARFRPGDRVVIGGHYADLHDDELGIRNLRARLRISNDRLRREILEIEAANETMVLTIECVDPQGDRPVFRVVDARPGPSAEDLLEQDLLRLDRDGSDAAPILRLARRIVEVDRSLPESDFGALAREACERYLRRRDRELRPDDVETRLTELRELHHLLEDRKWTLGRLGELERRYPKADDIRVELIGLGCRKFRGEWMTYEDFKKLQGYEEYRGRWITRSERHFLKVVESWFQGGRNDTILRHRLDREYHLLATNGKTALGMQPEEVAQALGFPDRVFRHRVKERTFTQWTYDDRYYYFIDGQLFHSPEEESALR